MKFNDPICEAAKASQNVLYASQKAACEAAKGTQNNLYAAQKAACEAGKASQNALYAKDKAACEAQKALEKADCERIKSQEKLACELGLAGPFSCRAQEIVNVLRTTQQDSLTEGDKWSALISTPAKGFAQGWRATDCAASGVGRLYRDPARSQDGIWTVDVEVVSIDVGGVQKPGRTCFLRLEVKPTRFGGGKAHDFFNSKTIKGGELVKFQGPVFIDKDGPFLEVHPGDTFEKVVH